MSNKDRLPNWASHYERPDESFPDYYKQFGNPEDDYTISDEDVDYYAGLSDEDISG